MGRALSLKYTKYWVLEGAWVVPGIAPPGTHPVPYPGYTLPPRLAGQHGTARTVTQEEYGRGAHIRPTTLFKYPDLRVPRYDRGLTCSKDRQN